MMPDDDDGLMTQAYGRRMATEVGLMLLDMDTPSGPACRQHSSPAECLGTRLLLSLAQAGYTVLTIAEARACDTALQREQPILMPVAPTLWDARRSLGRN